MKKIILLTLLLSQTYALEIQCFSQNEGVHSTIIKEDNSDRYFVVFDDGENFLNYLQLEPEQMVITDNEFYYDDEELKIQVSDHESGTLTALSSDVLLGKQYSSLNVSKCKFINTEI